MERKEMVTLHPLAGGDYDNFLSDLKSLKEELKEAGYREFRVVLHDLGDYAEDGQEMCLQAVRWETDEEVEKRKEKAKRDKERRATTRKAR